MTRENYNKASEIICSIDFLKSVLDTMNGEKPVDDKCKKLYSLFLNHTEEFEDFVKGLILKKEHELSQL